MPNKEKISHIAPLEGIKVVEVAQWVAAPAAAAILADWGADVVKIEHPERGDACRGMVIIGGMPLSDVNYPWELDNRNKRGITLDISKKEGRDVMHRLVEKCDVFLSSVSRACLFNGGNEENTRKAMETYYSKLKSENKMETP